VPGRRAVRRRGLPLPRTCASLAGMRFHRGCALRPQVCESRYATADECATAADRTKEAGRGTPFQWRQLDRSCGGLGSPSRRGITASGEGGSMLLRRRLGPSVATCPPPGREKAASPHADASAATTANRFHSRRRLLRPAPSTGISPTGQQDPLQQGFFRPGALQQGPLRPGPLQAAAGLPRPHPDAEGRWWRPPAWPLAAWPVVLAARSPPVGAAQAPRA
jgi:hypothetical protein